jgi:hypothetical protein
MPNKPHVGLHASVQSLARRGYSDEECHFLSGAEACGRDVEWVKRQTAVIRREAAKKRSNKWKCWECGRRFDVKAKRCPVCEPVGA